MWVQSEKPKIARITRKLAEEWRDMLPIPNDRTLKERRLQVYRLILNAGEFRPVLWAKAYCVETGLVYRANGKHTCTLFASLDTMPELYAIIEEYRCDTLADLAALYATFDTREQMRSTSDINKTFAGVIPELKDVNEQIIAAIVSGLTYVEKFEQYATVPAPDRAEKLLDHVEFAAWVSGLITGSGDAKRKLRRIPVVAAMFVTWTKAKNRADVFWRAVIDESGAVPSLPDRKIAKWLVTMSLNTANNKPKSLRSNSREFYTRCIHAWNAWRGGRDNPSLRYQPDAPTPRPI